MCLFFLFFLLLFFLFAAFGTWAACAISVSLRFSFVGSKVSSNVGFVFVHGFHIAVIEKLHHAFVGHPLCFFYVYL